MMKVIALPLGLVLCLACGSTAFIAGGVGVSGLSVSSWTHSSSRSAAITTSSASTCNMVLKGLAKKAKEQDVVKAKAELLASNPDSPVFTFLKKGEGAAAAVDEQCTVLSSALKKPYRTLSVVAEYRRNMRSGFVREMLDPELFSPMFRVAGASAVCIDIGQLTGGCTLNDIEAVMKEQRTAQGSFPGPLALIVRDLIVDEFQIAQAKALGASSVTLQVALVGEERCRQLAEFANKIGIEVVFDVTSEEEVAQSVACGARIINVTGKLAPAALDLRASIPEGVIASATVDRRSDEGLDEIEDCWTLRDGGYNTIWVSEVLYKGGMDQTESSAAIIKAIRSKSSPIYARAKAMAGKGEGAREYLGYMEM